MKYRTIIGVGFCVAVTGCAMGPKFEVSQALSERQRTELGRVWVAPNYGSAESTEGITDGKGEGAAKGAGQATAAMWAGVGSTGAGDDAASAIVALFLLAALTPVVAAGGAVYGAAAADSAADVDVYQATLASVFASTESIYQRQLQDQLAGVSFVEVQLGDLAESPADSRLEVDFIALEGSGGGVKSNLRFTLRAETRLYRNDPVVPEYMRSYAFSTPVQELSDWAVNDGAPLLQAIDGLAAETVAAIIDDHFRAPAYRLQPLFPAAGSGFRPRRLSTDTPTFDWRLWDAAQTPADESELSLSYDLRLTSEQAGTRNQQVSGASEFRFDEPLASCSTYEWQVRAHYSSFGLPRQTEWSVPQRFRTPCGNGRGR